MTDSNVKLTTAAAAILNQLCQVETFERVDPFSKTSHHLVRWTDNPKNQIVKLVFAEGSFDGEMEKTGVRVNVRLINLLAEKNSLESWICLMSTRVLDLQRMVDYATKLLVK